MIIKRLAFQMCVPVRGEALAMVKLHQLGGEVENKENTALKGTGTKLLLGVA
jgi:hypothetical protein